MRHANSACEPYKHDPPHLVDTMCGDCRMGFCALCDEHCPCFNHTTLAERAAQDEEIGVGDHPVADVLMIPHRLRRALTRHGVETVNDLTRLYETDILAIQHIGEHSLQLIKAELARRGLRLAGVMPPRPNGVVEGWQAQSFRARAMTRLQTIQTNVENWHCMFGREFPQAGALVQCVRIELRTAMDKLKSEDQR